VLFQDVGLLAVTSSLVFLNIVDVILFLLLPLATIMEGETDKLAEK